ncbi:MAG TPA: histidinol-phosphate transaminase [Eubacteriaceae bacterium]|nr:histidinol-phosphate transaminase [Eubacteriaceae bacterium]
MKKVFRKELMDLIPYKPGKPIADVQREYGLDKVYKLASNENPLGCSPKVKNAIINALDNINLYPDGNATLLKEKLSSITGFPTSQILPSSGLDEMIDQIAKTFINDGEEAIMSDHSFVRYIGTTKMMGGVPVIVPMKDGFVFDLDEMLKRINENTKLIWICNPNNPTGTMLSEDQVASFFSKVPEDIIIVYDEAYREFATHKDFPHDSLKFLRKYPNIIIMRTFSKVYGLAALRVGYTIASEEIIENLNKIRPAFNVNSLAQVAALAAIEDKDFVEKTIHNNNIGKEYLYKEFDKMNLNYALSQTNHIWVDVEKDAQEVFVNLQKKGVIIRPQVGNFIRVSIGLAEENEYFIKCLREELGK